MVREKVRSARLSADWFLGNTYRYDGYDRTGKKPHVYAGEYACHLPDRANTLYGALTTLTERGWIEAVGEDEGRRKEYRITPEGRAAVRAELARLQELTANGEALTRDWT